MTVYRLFFLFSYLKTLLIPINDVTNKLIEQLKPFADGVTKVPMKLRFGDFILNVISKVIKSLHMRERESFNCLNYFSEEFFSKTYRYN